jgi:hypothetical protein
MFIMTPGWFQIFSANKFNLLAGTGIRPAPQAINFGMTSHMLGQIVTWTSNNIHYTGWNV